MNVIPVVLVHRVDQVYSRRVEQATIPIVSISYNTLHSIFSSYLFDLEYLVRK